MSIEFVGKSLALSNAGLGAAAQQLSVKAPEIWTVLEVETSACGFLPDRRPPILFERHIFHRLTSGRFDDGDISDPTPGGYGGTGANQYLRLARAMAKDRGAALKSASWGLGQIMGENFASAGFSDVDSMVSSMIDSEDAQLAAVVSFLKHSHLDVPLQTHDWASFARGYNGPSFANNKYDARLRGEFQKFSFGVLPDLAVRTAQLYLTFCGFEPGPVDGVAGSLTRAAIAAYRKKEGLPVTEDIDNGLLAALTQTISA